MDVTIHEFWIAFILFGVGGLGLGVGLITGVLVARTLRRYYNADKKESNGKSDY